MIKMIVTDLDDTLFRHDKSMTPYTFSILEKIRNLGVKIVYATARGHSANRFAPSHLFDGHIRMNGAVGLIDDVYIYSSLIPPSKSKDILVASDAYGLRTAIEYEGMQYSNFDLKNRWSFETRFEMIEFKDISVDAEKIYMLIENDADVEFLSTLVPSDLYLSVSRDNFAQIMDKKATQYNAVVALAKYWDIAPNEIVAFGDDSIDIEMIRECGIGVAVSNAIDTVKAAADYICDSNDNDGVAKWIEENIDLFI